jgi:parallel beta-helix repeat protein
MRKHFNLIIAICLSCTSVQASNYYFSSTLGNDSRTALQAQNPNTPWKTISQLNASFNSFKPGDSILFYRGDSFLGSLHIQKSGTTAQPIVFSYYGDKTKNSPQITGLIPLLNWVNLGNGISESSCPSCGSTVNIVLRNGTSQTLGRYPNSNAANNGYLAFESHSGSGTIIDNQLGASPNWTGAQLVIRPNRWVVDRDSITLHSGTSIKYNSASGYTPIDNFGYFIQNHISTLDQLGEWFYNAGTKKLDMFFGTANPSLSTVLVSSTDNLVVLNNQNNIVFSGLAFWGSNKDAISISGAQNVSFLHCSIKYSGVNAISGTNTLSLLIQSDTVAFTNNTALALTSNCRNTSILNNVIRNTGVRPGMGQSGNNTYEGILISGNNTTITNNSIDSTGYIGIDFTGDSMLIKNNFVNHFTQTKDDGGGIYTWTGSSNQTVSVNRKIIGNIILNGTGAGEGTDNPADLPSEGIYMDDNTGNVDITGNTVANCGDNGIYIHNAHNITIKQNTLYNNTKQLEMGHDGNCPNCLIVNNSITDNIVVSKWINQNVFGFTSIGNDLAGFGAFDSNYYCRPYDDNFSLYNTYTASGAQVNVIQDLQIWQSAYQKDPASKKSPITFLPYAINSYTGSNMYTNGTFASNINGLYSYSAQSNANVAWDNSGKLDGGALSFSFSPASGLPNISKIIIAAGAVTAGKNYIVKFSLLGTKNNKALDVFFRQSLSPYSNLNTPMYCKVNKVRSEVQLMLTPSVSETNASLVFEIGEQDSTLWLDNIQIQEAAVTMSNPDDNILFEYNISSVPLTIALSSNYIDMKNRGYSGNLTLAPFSSIILLKTPTVTAIQNESAIALPGQMIAYPNPFTSVLTVSVTGATEGENSAELYDLSGRLVLSRTIHLNSGVDHFLLDVNELPPSVYLLKVNSSGKVFQSKVIKMKLD